MNRRLRRIFSAASILCALFLAVLTVGPASAEDQTAAKARQKAMEQEAALNLWRLNKAIEDDGFYAARMALNIWRSTAIDAGTFDPATYDELKKKLYEKSVSNSLTCFEFFLLEKSYHDASMCLQTWKIHSQELGSFEPTKYEELKKRLETARVSQNTEEKKTE